MTTTTTQANKLDDFTRAYIECALWASIDLDTCEPLDDTHTIADLAEETLQAMIADCQQFQTENGHLFEGVEGQAGHDFWLTRNHHGAGFWDRGRDFFPNDPNGEQLTQKAHEAGEKYLYIGDDGKLYID